MKTKQTTKREGLPSRTEHRSTDTAKISDTARPRIDWKRRNQNRGLATEKLLTLLQAEAPEFFALAEVVGKWVWIHFADKQPSDITAKLAEFGFHWNNKRQTWQHPCGTTTDTRTDSDPRERYGSRFAAAA